jgi:hypothetical protein
MFQELASTPATMAASKFADFYGLKLGNVLQTADVTSAYLQTLLKESEAITVPPPIRDFVTSCQSSRSSISSNNANHHVNTLAAVEEHPEPFLLAGGCCSSQTKSRSFDVPPATAECLSSELIDCDSMNGKCSSGISINKIEGASEVYHKTNEQGNCSISVESQNIVKEIEVLIEDQLGMVDSLGREKINIPLAPAHLPRDLHIDMDAIEVADILPASALDTVIQVEPNATVSFINDETTDRDTSKPKKNGLFRRKQPIYNNLQQRHF